MLSKRMRSVVRLVGPSLCAVAAVALVLGVGTTASARLVYEELDEAEVFIEWNSTDTDYGIQFFWDSDGFRSMQVRNERKRVLDVRTGKNLRQQGLSEGFFESVEPPSSELSMEEFFERFPEGDYFFRGRGIERGVILVGETEFTHVLPAPPTNLSPGDDDVVSHTGFLASFDEVTTDTEGDPLDVVKYEVIFEKEDDDPILQVYSVILPPGQTSVWVPEEFLEPDTEYKLEIIVQEESGNRTIAETTGIFTDAP